MSTPLLPENTRVVAVLMGRAGSSGFPGKNLLPVVGRPMMEYPLLAARQSEQVGPIYVSTDCPRIAEIGRRYGARIIDRPPELCTSQALGEEVYRHAHEHIRTEIGEVELLVLLMCNAPTVTAELIDRGVAALRADPRLDSAVSVSRYNMWSPLRARRVSGDGFLLPFVPFAAYEEVDKLSCDRDSQGDVYFADMGVSIVRPGCLDRLEEGMLPQKWMGRRIHPIVQWGGLDVDYEWQVPQVEFWLRAHGYVEPTQADDRR